MLDKEFDSSDIDITDIGDGIPDLSDTQPEELEDAEDELDVSDEDYYHAEHMSDEEVARIDEMWDESKKYSDVEPYKALSSEELSDVNDSDLTDEEKFAAEIETMSLDELQAERDRLEELSKMDDIDFFSEYDEQSEATTGSFDEMIGEMQVEQLAELKEKLEARDSDTLEYLGIEDDGEGNNDLSLKLTKKR